MEFSVDNYLQELLRDTSIPEDKVKALKETLADPKVESRLKDTVLMRSDYSRNMDKIREEETALQTKLKETEDFYQAQIMADHNNREAFENLRTENERLKSGSYSFNSDGQVNESYITKKQHQDELTKLQAQSLELMGKTNFLTMRHFKDFGEPLNMEEVFKHAMSKHLPLDSAYDSYTAELRSKRADEKHQEEIRQAREEGARDALSKHNLPIVDSRPHSIHAIRDMSSESVGHTSAERVAAATNAYLRGEK